MISSLLVAAPQMAAAAGRRVDLRVLVLHDGSSSVGAIAAGLAREGVPTTTVELSDPARPIITDTFLAEVTASSQRARFQAVVVPDPNLSRLSLGEVEALQAYQRTYGVRQVDAYTWPNNSLGTEAPSYSGSMDGATATVTAAGRAAGFGYLDGPIAFDVGSYGYLARPLATQAPGVAFTPLVEVRVPGQVATGSLIGAYTHPDGREELVITASANDQQLHQRALVHGIIGWATRGIHLGLVRNYFSVHIDDVLLPDDRWSIDGNCTAGGCPVGPNGEVLHDEPVIRMTAQDVDFLRSWQARTGLKLDLAFNAEGSLEAIAAGGSDPLTDALLSTRHEYRWINHTWSHPFVGCIQDFTVNPWRCATDADGSTRWFSQAELTEEIALNQEWAVANGLAMDPAELITGEHSGLRVEPQQAVDNPNLGPALAATGITVIASDNSREPSLRAVGEATALPRYPMNIFYNVATEAEQVDEYNWIYTSVADGGSGICEADPATTCMAPLDLQTGFDDHIVPLEASIALRHVLGNDPRPHFAHQSNLAEERILYPVLDTLVERYQRMYADNMPLVQPTMTQAAVAMARQDDWAELLSNNPEAVQAYLVDGMVRIETGLRSVQVPVTAPLGTLVNGTSMTDAYGGESSGWVTVTPGSAPPTTPPSGGTARSGYWMVGAKGDVYAFGDARHLGNANVGNRVAVDIEATPDFNGYWIVDDGGAVHAFNAPHFGNAPTLPAGERVSSLSATATGRGYWLFTDKGRAIPKGDAVHRDDMLGVALNGPVLDSIRTARGGGYYMVASDGGIFSFGDAQFHGSMGGAPLNAPVRSLAPDPDGVGYWLVAGDGGIFAFDAAFRGSMGGKPLNRPVVGMVPYGDGYLMVASDGGIFNFSDKPFAGSLGASPPAVPVVGVAALNER